MTVRVDRLDGRVARVVMDRPARRNALDAEQWELLTETLREVAEDPPGCLVLTGAGETFAAGGDLQRFRAELTVEDAPRAFRGRIRACLDTLRTFPAPTVARVNGPALGGGFELAISCDVCVAVPTAQFAMPAASFGIVMALPDLLHLVTAVGASTARYLTMTGRAIDASEAHRIGLVHEIAEADQLDTAVERVTRRLTGADHDAALWFREACDIAAAALAGTPPSAEHIDELRRRELDCLASPALHERVDAFLERRR